MSVTARIAASGARRPCARGRYAARVALRPDVVLYLARHGQATSGPNHRWEASDPLTELGHAQAADLARHVATLDPAPTRVVVSPAVRSRETAAPCAATLGLAEEVDERLVEF